MSLDFGGAIRRLRTVRGLPQAVLAQKIGVTAPYLSSVEHGRRQPSRDLLQHVAEALSVPVEVVYLDAIAWDDVELPAEARRALRLTRYQVIDHVGGFAVGSVAAWERGARP